MGGGGRSDGGAEDCGCRGCTGLRGRRGDSGSGSPFRRRVWFLTAGGNKTVSGGDLDEWTVLHRGQLKTLSGSEAPIPFLWVSWQQSSLDRLMDENFKMLNCARMAGSERGRGQER